MKRSGAYVLDTEISNLLELKAWRLYPLIFKKLETEISLKFPFCTLRKLTTEETLQQLAQKAGAAHLPAQ